MNKGMLVLLRMVLLVYWALRELPERYTAPNF